MLKMLPANKYAPGTTPDRPGSQVGAAAIGQRLSRTVRAASPVIQLGGRSPVFSLALSAALCVLVVGSYITYLSRFATNGVYWDEWNWVDMFRRSLAGTLTVSDLWSPHNESRMLFPNILAMGIARLTGFNDMAFIWLGAALLVGGVLFVFIACRCEFRVHPLAYVPAALVFFSPAQYENTLWGFQFAWFLVVACICGVLALLTSPHLTVSRLSVATAVGIVGSYSLLQGLEVWPIGLLALMRPGISTGARFAWCVAGVLVTAIYIPGMNIAAMGGPPLSALPTELPTAALGFLVAVGSVVPNVNVLAAGQTYYSATIAFGVLILASACAVVVSWWIHGRNDRVLTVAMGLVSAGLMFDVLLMPGRLGAGLINGTPSRYTTFNLLLLAGAYIGAVRTLTLATGIGGNRRIAIGGILLGITATMVSIQLPVAIRSGVEGGLGTRAAHAEAANLTANYAVAPPTLVAVFAYPPSYSYFQSGAEFLESNHLNVFGDGEADSYIQTGVLAGGAVQSVLPVPAELGDIGTDRAQWRAWLALSSVYEQRPDLQAAFPGATVKTSRAMVAWAVLSGLDPKDPIYAPILEPYADQYKAWMGEEQQIVTSDPG